MIEIKNTEVVGFEAAIRGMRNPMNSWDKSDSWTKYNTFEYDEFIMGNNDLTLAKKLANAGTDHSKFLRFIQVYCDINAPLYWWKEFDTYRMGVEKNSCSTMHKIQAKEFTLNDFSCEWLEWRDELFKEGERLPRENLRNTIICLNECREKFIETKDKLWWWQMIQLLPSSYNQKRTVMMSYAALKNMYHARKNHKLDEWRDFCKWVETLPYSELITDEYEND